MDQLAQAVSVVVRKSSRERPRRFRVTALEIAPRSVQTLDEGENERHATLHITVLGDAMPKSSPYHTGVFPLEIRLCQPRSGPPVATALRFVADVYHPAFNRTREGVDHTQCDHTLPSLHLMSPRLWKILEEVWNLLVDGGDATMNSSLQDTTRSSAGLALARERAQSPSVFNSKAMSWSAAVDAARPRLRRQTLDPTFEELFDGPDATAKFTERLRREGRRIDVAAKKLLPEIRSEKLAQGRSGAATTRVRPQFLYTRSLAFQYRHKLGAQLFEAFDGTFLSSADIMPAPTSSFPKEAATAGKRVGSTVPHPMAVDALYGPPSLSAPPVPIGQPIVKDAGPTQAVVHVTMRSKRYASGPGMNGGCGAVVSIDGIAYTKRVDVNFMPGGYSLLLLRDTDLAVLHYAQYSRSHPSGLREFFAALMSRPGDSIAIAFVDNWQADGVRDASWISAMGTNGADLLRKCGCRVWPNALDEAARAGRQACLHLKDHPSSGVGWDRIGGGMSRSSRRSDVSGGASTARRESTPRTRRVPAPSTGGRVPPPSTGAETDRSEGRSRMTASRTAAASALSADYGLAIVCAPRAEESPLHDFCVETILHPAGVPGAREARVDAMLAYDSPKYYLVNSGLMPKLDIADVVDEIGELWHWPGQQGSLTRMQRAEIEIMRCQGFLFEYRTLLYKIFSYYALHGMNTNHEMGARQWQLFVTDCKFEICTSDGHVLKGFEGEDAQNIFRDSHHENMDLVQDLREAIDKVTRLEYATSFIALGKSKSMSRQATPGENSARGGGGGGGGDGSSSVPTLPHPPAVDSPASSPSTGGTPHPEMRDTTSTTQGGTIKSGAQRSQMSTILRRAVKVLVEQSHTETKHKERPLSKMIVTMCRWRTIGNRVISKIAVDEQNESENRLDRNGNKEKTDPVKRKKTLSSRRAAKARAEQAQQKQQGPVQSSHMKFDQFLEAIVRSAIRCSRYQQHKTLGDALRVVLKRFIQDRAHRVPADIAFDKAYMQAREVRALIPLQSRIHDLFHDSLEASGPRAERVRQPGFVWLLKRYGVFGGGLSLSKALTAFTTSCGYRLDGAFETELDIHAFTKALCRCAWYISCGDQPVHTSSTYVPSVSVLMQAFTNFLRVLDGLPPTDPEEDDRIGSIHIARKPSVPGAARPSSRRPSMRASSSRGDSSRAPSTTFSFAEEQEPSIVEPAAATAAEATVTTTPAAAS